MPAASSRAAARSTSTRSAPSCARITGTSRTLVAAAPVPVHLMAAGERESALLEPDRGTLLATLPRERVSHIGGGHSLHRDRPALWLNAVLAFADSLDLRAGPNGA